MASPADDAGNGPDHAVSLRDLPAVHRVLDHPCLSELVTRVDHAYLVAAVQEELDSLRRAIADDPRLAVPDVDGVAAGARDRVRSWLAPALKPVVNLTGTLLHTNLGRAPLSEEALAAMRDAAWTVNLEYDLDAGKRGDRDGLVEDLLCRLTGAEAATVVNNNAAAVFLALNTLADRKRVAVSRGELVEIGDSFRMPDIVRKSGCRMVEVGTTNRTHLKDYRQALDDGARLLLKVHTSNYRIEGFVKEVPLTALAELGRAHGIPVVADLGSGALTDLGRWGLSGEPTVREVVEAGVDVVTFSGDKLLGGPQAGLIVGRQDWIRRIKRNPLKRALRCDKLRLAALTTTLREYFSPATLDRTLPAYRLIARSLDEIDDLASRVLPAVTRWAAGRASVSVVAGHSQVGSGSLPGDTLPTKLIALAPNGRGSVKALAAALRGLTPPVVGRIHGGSLLLDLRCLLSADDLLRALKTAPGGGG